MIDEKVLIERLEEYKYSHLIEHDSERSEHCEENDSDYCQGIDCFLCVWDKAIKIVKDLAEEHNNEFCEWRMIDEEANVYDTTCRNPHILLEGSPTDNNYEFCPYCGKKIKVVDAPYKKGE